MVTVHNDGNAYGLLFPSNGWYFSPECHSCPPISLNACRCKNNMVLTTAKTAMTQKTLCP